MTIEELPASELMDAYDLGRWHAVSVLPGGKSRHFLIETERGTVVIRRSYASKTLRDMQFEYDLVSYLRANHFPAHEIIPTRAGHPGLLIDGRLYSISVFVRGERFQPGNVEQLRAMAHTLGRYHTLMADFEPALPSSSESMLHEVLRERVASMPLPGQVAAFMATDSARQPQVGELLSALPFLADKGRAVAAQLEALYPQLPKLLIHGGCRRGSALFSGNRLRVMLDFDSARPEARIVDVAIALHDLAKVFTERGAPDHKVALDLDVVQAFLRAYADIVPLQPQERDALPALMQARPLKRALGKCRSLIVDGVDTPGHIRKATQEMARVRWLDAHDGEFEVRQAAEPAPTLPAPSLAAARG